MNCKILFNEKNKNNVIKLSSAELVHNVLRVEIRKKKKKKNNKKKKKKKKQKQQQKKKKKISRHTLTQFSLETPVKVIGKRCRPKSVISVSTGCKEFSH